MSLGVEGKEKLERGKEEWDGGGGKISTRKELSRAYKADQGGSRRRE